ANCRADGSAFCREFSCGKKVTARDVCLAAANGDSIALGILENSGRYLGMGLSVLIDLLNPERIVIGSIYTHCRDFLEPFTVAVIQNEALEASRMVCSVVPAALGKSIGDYGSLGVAINALEKRQGLL
ncbi:MAG: ROK family protein, partial [Spirochaetia bacterium]|nr:ROK family protein [Spirochaetia bacterium]